MTLEELIKANHVPVLGNSSKFARNYEYALNLFWNHEGEELIEFISKQIEESSIDQNVFVFYRIWIEQLSRLQEWAALHELKKHLVFRSYEDPGEVITWQALRALIHFELDEQQAVDLYIDALEGNTDNPYFLELHQKVSLRRTGVNDENNLSLLNCTSEIYDYFHWQSLGQGLLSLKNYLALHSVSDCISRIFPNSPFYSEVGYHCSLDSEDFSKAVEYSKWLNEKFDNNRDYRFWYGFAAFHKGELNLASKMFLSGRGFSSDIDALTMLGCCYQELAAGNVADPSHSRALEIFKKAQNECREQNLPSTDLECTIDKMLMEQKLFLDQDANFDNFEHSHAWLIKMSPRQYAEMLSNELADIEYIRTPVEAQSRKGDLVFFAADDPLNKNGRWRIVSIYTLTTDPSWHPVRHFECELELVYRMDTCLEVDVCFDDEEFSKQEGEQNIRSPYPHMYALEGGALEIITEAVHRRNEERPGDEFSNALHQTISSIKRSS
ncbi:MAG: hypothetical protein R3B45_02080 [Bdellovibrionota bacterium]